MKSPHPQILCVDDDIQTVEWIRESLASSKVNAAITTVSTGREAWGWLQKERCDLCILEYALPDMTGAELCSLVRRMGRRVPMMFFTALDRPVDLQMALAAGASDYLYKPDAQDIFVDAVIHLLKKHGPRSAASTTFALWPKAA